MMPDWEGEDDDDESVTDPVDERDLEESTS